MAGRSGVPAAHVGRVDVDPDQGDDPLSVPFAPATPAGADDPLDHGRTVASLFSGVGGFDLGLERAGWRVIFQCEQDPFRQRVLAHHWPDALACPDVRKAAHAAHPEYQFGQVDLLCGGFPCQDLSVAGRRRGLAGERSGLFFEFARIADRVVRPGGFVLIENVPGLLSSNNGRDFAVVLATLAELGFHDLAWRIMDSRHFGVPQRRRRVYVLGRRARGRMSAEVLLEQDGSGRDLAARRPTWARAPAAPGAGAGERGGGGDVAHALTAHHSGQRNDPTQQTFVGAFDPREASEAIRRGDIARAILNAPQGHRHDTSGANYVVADVPVGQGVVASDPDVSGTLGQLGGAGRGYRTDLDASGAYVTHAVRPGAGGGDVAHTLTSGGHDASEDGSGRGTPLVVPDAVREAAGGAPSGGRRVVGPRDGEQDAERDGAGGDERGGRGSAPGAADAGSGPTADADGVREAAGVPGRLDDPAGVDAYALRGREGGMQAEPIDLPNLRAHTGKDGGGVDGFVHDRRDPACIHPDAMGRTGESKTLSPDANGKMRLRDAGIGVSDDGLSYSLMTGRPPAVGPVGFQSTLGSLAADGVQADGVSVPLMEATPAAVSYDPTPPPQEYGEGAASPYDPKPDGPRYAAMGDAVTVNVLEWIGLRLATALDLEETA